MTHFRATNLVLLATLTLGFTAAASAQKTYKIQMKPQIGKTYTFVSDMNLTASMPGSKGENTPMVQKIKMTLSMKPTKAAKGKTTMVSTIKSMSANGADMMSMMKGNTTNTTEFDASGRVVGGKNSQSFAGTSFPQKPIKIGESWTSKFSMGPQSYESKCKLVDVQKKNGLPAFHLKVSMSDQAPMKLSQPIDVWIEQSTGMMIQINMKGSMPAQKAKMTMVMKRV